MLTTSDFSKGTRILFEDQPYVILDIVAQSPSARGASTLIKIKARNLLDGKLIQKTFKSGEKFEEPEIRFSEVQYLYNEGDAAVFMDQSTYEQFNISLESIGNQAKYLSSELKIRAMYFNENPVNIEIPEYIKVKIDRVEPGAKGNTSSSTVLTNAYLEDGTLVRVPLNIKDGDEIMIDTNNDSYHQRA